MSNIIIKSINELLNIRDLDNQSDIAIVFITTKPNYYDFGHTQYYMLPIEDRDIPQVARYHIDILHILIQDIKVGECKTVYICCDAGLRRSPAVALYLAHKLHDTKLIKQLEWENKHVWMDLFKKLMEEDSKTI